MIKTTFTNTRRIETTIMKRKKYINGLKKKQLRKILNKIMDNYMEPLGLDAPVQFRESVFDDEFIYGETGLFCLHSGEKIG